MGWLMEISLCKLGELWLTIHTTLFVSHFQMWGKKRKKLISLIGECPSRQLSIRLMTIIWLTKWLLSTRNQPLFRLLKLTIQDGVGQKLSKPISDKLLRLTILASTRGTILILRPKRLVKRQPCPWKTFMPIRLSICPKFLNRTEFALFSSIFPT